MSHTPGPWRVHSEVPNRIILNGSACYEVECSTSKSALCNRADVRLMAAAPELLAELKYLVEQFEEAVEWVPEYVSMANGAKAAIAKAEGRSHADA